MNTEYILSYRLFGSDIDFDMHFKTEPEAYAKLYKLKTSGNAFCIKLDKVTHLNV